MRTEVLATWRERILDAYPAEAASFMRRGGDRFENPVGAALVEATGSLLDGLLDGRAAAELEAPLDRLVRLRAVQDMPPSQAVGFVLALKQVVRAAVATGGGEAPVAELEAFDRRVDLLALAAFDVYARCREEVFAIRVKEIRTLSLDTLERLNAWRERRSGGTAADPDDRAAGPQPAEP